MSRISFFLMAVLLALLPALASAAPVNKRPAQRWHGYGFLPGYRQPPNNTVPIYGARHSRDHTPRYWYNGTPYYFGEPGFYHGRYNGGSFGPCWTSTPIGLIWNCG